MSAPINRKTGQRWTVTTLLDAVLQMNEIANRMADDYGHCESWEDIMEKIVEETGLPLDGRAGSQTVNMTIRFRWTGRNTTDSRAELCHALIRVLASTGEFHDPEVTHLTIRPVR